MEKDSKWKLILNQKNEMDELWYLNTDVLSQIYGICGQ
jgi:hypothetical protein